MKMYHEDFELTQDLMDALYWIFRIEVCSLFGDKRVLLISM